MRNGSAETNFVLPRQQKKIKLNFIYFEPNHVDWQQKMVQISRVVYILHTYKL